MNDNVGEIYEFYQSEQNKSSFFHNKFSINSLDLMTKYCCQKDEI